MRKNKIIRSVCYFSDTLDIGILKQLEGITTRLEANDYTIQTKRICSKDSSIAAIRSVFIDPSLYLSVGTLDRETARNQFNDFIHTDNVAFNLDLSNGVVPKDSDFLFNIIKSQPSKTFSFTYTFNNSPSSPYFPSATYQKNGFSIGLQPTDLSMDCNSLDEWFQIMKSVWDEIFELFYGYSSFLGIDSSIAPLFTGKSSLIHFVRRIQNSFSHSLTTDLYIQISNFIKQNNPKPIGLCGIMLPCLEDFALATEYEAGDFSIERNVYLSLHCGLGIDTYPVGVNESSQKIYEILCLLQGLSHRYHKPLSARFVSDGIAKIGEKTDLKNPYLKDVIVNPL
jgi:hypothetical protein